jgi:E3 ubiquitin-protein ligase RNF5
LLLAAPGLAEVRAKSAGRGWDCGGAARRRMDADEAVGSSGRMDLNLYLGPPRAPRPRRSDLGSDLALSTPMPSSPSSSAASVDAPPPPPESMHPPYTHSRADLSPPPLPLEVYFPYNPEDSPVPDAHMSYMQPPELLIPGPRNMPPPDSLISGLREGIRELRYAFHPPPPPPPPLVRANELLGWEERPSSSTASSSFFPDTAARCGLLLEQTGSRWLRTRRFRSDLPPLSSEARPSGQDATEPVPQHEPAADANELNKVAPNGLELGAPENSSEERSKTATAFECNICFEMASEPVVTSCGHLFCWSCLYQWLNVYSSHKECPVCKGEVTEANITPIYGRGNSDAEKTVEDWKSPGPTIPPRPHGHRLESFWQQFHHIRPISRRLGEAHGILSSWRRLLDQQILGSVSRLEGPSESATQEINDIRQHDHLSGLALASRMRARRFQIEALSRPDGSSTSPPDNGLTGNNPSEFLTGNNALLERLAGSNSRRLELLERLAFGIANTAGAMSDDFRRIASPNQYRGSASSSNLQNNEPAVDGARIAGAPSADQASNSSTVAVIQGDGGISESAGEPTNAGSSGSLRRRGRSNASGSLDVDGGSLQQNKRHRMN